MTGGPPTTPVTAARWTSARLSSRETCSLLVTASGWRIQGQVLVPVEGLPSQVDYTVVVDPAWGTRRADLLVRAAGHAAGTPRAIELANDGGAWLVNGEPRADLDGCTDVDLGFSPATNTLPIRRLGLAVGANASIDVAWVTFPSFEVRRSTQTYERIAEHRWRYRSGSFTADMDVDSHGLVRRYGDIWTDDGLR